jgi:hypothetical protein
MFGGLFGKKKKEEGGPPQPPQLAPYQTPFALTGDVVVEKGNIYKCFGKADHAQFRDMCDSTDGWVLRHGSGGTYCWTLAKKGESMNMIKVFGAFDDISPEIMNDILHDPEYRIVWDESRIDSYRVASLDAVTDIGYYALRMNKPVANRDFLNQRGWTNAGGGEYVIFNTSVPHDDMPPAAGFVRAVSKISGYLVRPWGTKGGCSLTFLTQTDPKGWLPSSVVNGITTKLAPRTTSRLRDAASKYTAWVATQGANHKKDWVAPEAPWDEAKPNRLHEWAAAREGDPVHAEQVVVADESSAEPSGEPSPVAAAGEDQ